LAVTAKAVSESHTMPLLRYPDVVVVVVAAIPALALGAPVLGYVVGAAAWILQRVLLANRHRWVSLFTTPGSVRRAGFNTFEAFGRIWLLAIAIIVARLAGDRADGLTAAVVIFAAYSITFIMRLVSGPPQEIG
jgi:uncharacterized MAPEG superfamily protein